MAGLTFAFNPDAGETPDSLEAKRSIALALARSAMGSPARNAGEGISKVGNALAYAFAMGNYENSKNDLAKQQAAIWPQIADVMGGGAAPSAPSAAPAPATPLPIAPSIPSEALTPGPMSDTPAPLSGGTLPQNSAALTDAVAQLESSNSPVNGPVGRYVNYRFQQFPAFVKQYGSGEDGVTNYAKQVLAANPNATFGDMYGGYVTGTGNPATAAEASLKTTTQPGAKGAYANLVNNSPVDPKTPLSQLLASRIGNLLGPASAYADTPKPGDTLMQEPQAPGTQAAPLPPPVEVASLPGAVAPSPAAANPRQQVAQALMRGPGSGSFAPVGGPEPNITTVPVRPTSLPIAGSQALAQAPQAPQTTPSVAPVDNRRQAVARALQMLQNPQLSKVQQSLLTGFVGKELAPKDLKPQVINGRLYAFDPQTGTPKDVTPAGVGYQPLVTPQDRAKFGISPSDNRPYQIGPDGKLVTPPGAPTVNIDQRAESSFEQNYGKELAGEASDIVALGDKAATNLQKSALLSKLLTQAETGKLTPATSTIGAWMQSAGINPAVVGIDPNLPATSQSISGLANEMILGKIGKGGFPANNFSEQDRKFLLSTIPQLGDTPAAARLKLEVSRRLDQLAVEKADAWATARDQHKNFDTFQSEWRRNMTGKNVFADLAGQLGQAPAQLQAQPSRQDIEDEMRRRGLLK